MVEWLKRLSHWKGRVRQRQAPESKVTRGKQRDGNWARNPKTKLVVNAKASWDVQKRAGYHRSASKKKKEFSGIKTRVERGKNVGRQCPHTGEDHKVTLWVSMMALGIIVGRSVPSFHEQNIFTEGFPWWSSGKKLYASAVGVPSLIPGQGTRSHMPQLKILRATNKTWWQPNEWMFQICIFTISYYSSS